MRKAAEPANAVKSYLFNLPKDIEVAKKTLNKINATSGAHVPEEVKKAYEEKFQQHADKPISIRVKLEDLQALGAQQEVDLKGATIQADDNTKASGLQEVSSTIDLRIPGIPALCI